MIKLNKKVKTIKWQRQCMKVKSEIEVAHWCPTQQPHGLQPSRLLHPWDFPGKSTGVGCHYLLQRHQDNDYYKVFLQHPFQRVNNHDKQVITYFLPKKTTVVDTSPEIQQENRKIRKWSQQEQKDIQHDQRGYMTCLAKELLYELCLVLNLHVNFCYTFSE